jgi:predicted TIM-barrel fold metal-dependent hydrolase
MIKKTVQTMTANRVLFATDMFVEEGVGKLLAAELSDEEMQKICHDNIVKLLSGKMEQ